jgi:hypothetical protein
MTANGFREIEGLSLPPLLISLGLTEQDFPAPPVADGSSYTTCLSGGSRFPGSTLFLSLDEWHAFQRDTGQWRHDDWPQTTAACWGIPGTGIDAATWAGPKYENLYYFFVNNSFLRWNTLEKRVDIPVTPLVQNGFGSGVGNWFGESGCDAAVHDERLDLQSRLHIFKHDQYLRHNLDNGSRDLGPGPIQEFWPGLPEPFASAVDYVFWGGADDVGKLIFVRNGNAAVYDPDGASVVRQGTLGEVVRGFSERSRPQLFLKEEYVLHRYVGDIERGSYVRSDIILARTLDSQTRTIEREYLQRSSTTKSVLESTDTQAVNDLASHVQNNQSEEGSAEQYQYAMTADFHGDAEADSLWGGEVNAHLGVQGGTNDLRSAFARSVEQGISQQVRNSTATVNQQKADESLANEESGRSKETSSHTAGAMDKDSTIVVDFYQIMQRYLTVLVLEHASLAYIDAATEDAAELFDMDRLLDTHVVEASRAPVRNYIVGELSKVNGLGADPLSVIRTSTTGDTYSWDNTVTSTIPVVTPDGTQEAVTVRGVAESTQTRTVGTDQMRPWT